MITRFLGAIQFLTIVPVKGNTASPGQSAPFFPLIGAALGAAGAGILFAPPEVLPRSVTSLIALGFWAAITGGLHEDGLADTADAFRAGRSREKILAILKDSHIGAHGTLALILISLVRWQALSSITVNPLLPLTIIFAVSRGSLVLLAWISPPVGSGLGFEFSRMLTSASAVIVAAQVVLWGAFSGVGTLLLWGTFVIIMVARQYYLRRIGGVTGDCLGATCLLVETWGLILFSCRRCM